MKKRSRVRRKQFRALRSRMKKRGVKIGSWRATSRRYRKR